MTKFKTHTLASFKGRSRANKLRNFVPGIFHFQNEINEAASFVSKTPRVYTKNMISFSFKVPKSLETSGKMNVKILCIPLN